MGRQNNLLVRKCCYSIHKQDWFYVHGNQKINSLLNDKILDWSKIKAFADDQIFVTEQFKFVLRRVENMGKGENAGYQYFLLIP